MCTSSKTTVSSETLALVPLSTSVVPISIDIFPQSPPGCRKRSFARACELQGLRREGQRLSARGMPFLEMINEMAAFSTSFVCFSNQMSARQILRSEKKQIQKRKKANLVLKNTVLNWNTAVFIPKAKEKKGSFGKSAWRGYTFTVYLFFTNGGHLLR